MAGRRTRFRYSLHSGNLRVTTGFLLLGALSIIGVLLLVALSGAPAEVESLIRQPQVTISPATSNKDLRFTGDFDQVFRPSSLHGAFRQHAAYEAVFETEAGLQRDRETAELQRKFGADFRRFVFASRFFAAMYDVCSLSFGLLHSYVAWFIPARLALV